MLSFSWPIRHGNLPVRLQATTGHRPIKTPRASVVKKSILVEAPGSVDWVAEMRAVDAKIECVSWQQTNHGCREGVEVMEQSEANADYAISL